MSIRPRILGLVALLLLACSGRGPAAGFELKEGDRVVFLGNTLVEQEQRSGYWETALTTRFPERNVTFRNLGWSGDTVWGEARAGFGSVADGFRQLHEHVFALKPTVLFIGYGTNEAFAGKEGLDRFIEGYEKLLDTLVPTKARMILLSPIRQEKMPPPLPDPSAINDNLRAYTDAIRRLADRRSLRFVNLFEPPSTVPGGREFLTHNGLHPTEFGYWVLTDRLLSQLDLRPRNDKPWRIEVDATAAARPVLVEGTRSIPAAFSLRTEDDFLPRPSMPNSHEINSSRELVVRGLAPGNYRLLVDGVEVARAPAEAWRAGKQLPDSPDQKQVELLRERIVAKNLLYFHRWRPQNETYLFGFRKHEQGQNAKEIVEFDPLIAKEESAIAKLRKPHSHSYELLPVAENKK